MYGFTLILTLVIVGGVIAYIGDRLGMHVGRKKLTLFGLRPKHTSIVVTIVTGILISAASIGVLSIGSSDVRTALFNMKAIQDELRGIQRDYVVMKGQRDAAQVELEQVEASYQEITALLLEAESTVDALQRQAVVLTEEVEELEARTEQLRSSYALLEENYDLVATAWGQIRAGNIAFNASEVILTTVIRKGLGREEVRAHLERFMEEVDDVAYLRSARAPESDTYRAIFLQPGVLDMAVESVLLSPGDVIVRAVSEGNSIPGVPVLVYLENFRDQMVFSQGTVLASSRWDPREGMEIDRVILLMLNEAHSNAINAGMAISRERGDAVLLPGDSFRDAIFASRDIEESVEVRLVVAEDTWRSETPVELYLELVF
ncbi:MAG: DUF3084 domain-containing protein [Bacillota bacterium]|jgi:uncharacterized protein (DUF3084 family)|nr:DUF3084 domain-containing protein [Bacillota bacterium]HHT89440.1 DUF3084 domain-containing protein [Bacillota bacterium]